VRLKTIPIFLAFFVMGVADAMGPMSDAAQAEYHLDALMSTLLSFFVFIAFAIFSVPGGVLAARIGKKKLLLLGVGLNAVAVLIPSRLVEKTDFSFHRHRHFLLCRRGSLHGPIPVVFLVSTCISHCIEMTKCSRGQTFLSVQKSHSI
jgi:MFS family permease